MRGNMTSFDTRSQFGISGPTVTAGVRGSSRESALETLAVNVAPTQPAITTVLTEETSTGVRGGSSRGREPVASQKTTETQIETKEQAGIPPSTSPSAAEQLKNNPEQAKQAVTNFTKATQALNALLNVTADLYAGISDKVGAIAEVKKILFAGIDRSPEEQKASFIENYSRNPEIRERLDQALEFVSKRQTTDYQSQLKNDDKEINELKEKIAAQQAAMATGGNQLERNKIITTSQARITQIQKDQDLNSARFLKNQEGSSKFLSDARTALDTNVNALESTAIALGLKDLGKLRHELTTASLLLDNGLANAVSTGTTVTTPTTPPTSNSPYFSRYQAFVPAGETEQDYFNKNKDLFAKTIELHKFVTGRDITSPTQIAQELAGYLPGGTLEQQYEGMLKQAHIKLSDPTKRGVMIQEEIDSWQTKMSSVNGRLKEIGVDYSAGLVKPNTISMAINHYFAYVSANPNEAIRTELNWLKPITVTTPPPVTVSTGTGSSGTGLSDNRESALA
jgi:hypothetical protein